jgi:hypothetical protein
MKGFMQTAKLNIQNKWFELCFGKRENSRNSQINKKTGTKFTIPPNDNLDIQFNNAWL